MRSNCARTCSGFCGSSPTARSRKLDSSFWGVHSQGEIDLLLIRDGIRRGFEIKYTDRPAVTASQTLALESLKLDRIDVVCPGAASYPLGEKIHVCGLERAGDLFGLRLDPTGQPIRAAKAQERPASEDLAR